jgi:hypothetical protein
MATVQATSHMDVVYGPKYADALRDSFLGTLIIYGANERHLLEQASDWLGLATRRSESYDDNSGGVSPIPGPPGNRVGFVCSGFS